MGSLQVGRAGVEVHVDGLSADLDWGEEFGVAVDGGVGRDAGLAARSKRVEFGSRRGSIRIHLGHDQSILPKRLYHGSSSISLDRPSRALTLDFHRRQGAFRRARSCGRGVKYDKSCAKRSAH